MLFEESVPQLWWLYYILALLLTLTLYLGLMILPRLVQCILTGGVAGMMLMPAPYQLPLVEANALYQGWAPSAMVVAVGVLDGPFVNRGLGWLLGGAVLGGLIGGALWFWRRQQAEGEEGGRTQARSGVASSSVSGESRGSAKADTTPSRRQVEDDTASGPTLRVSSKTW